MKGKSIKSGLTAGFVVLAGMIAYAVIFRRGGGESATRGAKSSRAMTLDEAYLVLGLNRGAMHDEMLAAHRNLMKRFHPDQGGTCYLASKINEDKDVLLRHIKL